MTTRQRALRRMGSVAAVILLTGAILPDPSLAARPLAYSGHTSQRAGRYGVQWLSDNTVSFRMSRSSLHGFRIPWVAGCSDTYHRSRDAPLMDVVRIDSIPLTRGRFSLEGVAYTTSPGPGEIANVALDLHGVIRGRRASGTLSVGAQIAVDGGHISDLCATTHVVHWQATLRR